MALDVAKMRTRFTALLAQVPVSFTFGTTTISGTRSTLRKETAVAEYGSDSVYNFSIIAAYSSFATLPKKGDYITVGGTDYQVMRTETDPLQVAIRIDLGEKYG